MRVLSERRACYNDKYHLWLENGVENLGKPTMSTINMARGFITS